MVPIKRNIAIEITDDLVRDAAQSFTSDLERASLTGKTPFAALRHLDQIDPGMSLKIGTYDLRRPIRRSIVHDYPLYGQQRLLNQRFDRLLDEGLLIAGRRDQNVRETSAGLVPTGRAQSDCTHPGITVCCTHVFDSTDRKS